MLGQQHVLSEDDSDTPILIGKNVRHKFVEDNTDVWYNGTDTDRQEC